MRKPIVCLFLFCAVLTARASYAGEDGLKKSVVKIFTVTNRPNYYQPWDRGYQYNSSGSGCVLPGKRILTNAHVVSDQAFLQVMKAGDTKKYTAKVDYVDHDREVALLKILEEGFFENTVPVQFGEMPSQRDKVAVYGFPVGGDELSITEGVVSRIEVQVYTHSQRSFLTLQTDAAINPGNSGGPAFKGGKMIGIAFQSYGSGDAQNTGYIVPMDIIQKSLKDRDAGVLEASPSLGIYWQKMESPSLRAYYKMKPTQSGVLVTKVIYDSPGFGVLRDEDILMSFMGVKIANNGTVLFRKDERLVFSHVITQCRAWQKVQLEVLRDGKILPLSLELKSFEHLVPGPQYDVRPSYFIAGGLVFMPLTHNYLSLWKNNTAPTQLENFYENEMASKERKRVVFINEILPHEINVGYHSLKQAVVVRINGRPISELKDVVEAFRHPSGKYHVVELDHLSGGGDNFGNWVILEAKDLEKATGEILKSFGISKDRSEDMAENAEVSRESTKF